MFKPHYFAIATTLLCGLLQAVGAPAATLTVAVQTTDGRPLAGAVVTIRTLSGNDHPGVPVKAIMDQVNRAFVPDLLASGFCNLGM